MSLFERIAAWAYRHRRRMVAVWVVVAAGVFFAAAVAGSAYNNDFSLPGTESQRAQDKLEAGGPDEGGDSVDLVFAGTLDGRVDTIIDDVRALPSVAGIGELQRSRDGTVAYATVALDSRSAEVPVEDVVRLIDTAQAGAGDGLQVEVGGEAARDAQESEGGIAELIGIVAALVILVLLFGSLLAGALPLVTAVFAVGSSLALITLASHKATIADFTPAVMALVGLGVGIDYALLIFSRYRSEVQEGSEGELAVRTALNTAGRSVFFAGCTVMFALIGLYVLGLASLKGIALAVALTVLLTMVASLTLLPALLGLFGKRLERSIRKRSAKRPDGVRWERWSAFVQRRPLPALVVALPVLVALCLPVTGMHLGFADAGNDAKSTTARQAYDLLAKGFGPGFNGPLLVVSEGGDPAALERVIADTPGVAQVAPAEAEGDVATLLVFPASAPQDKRTDALIKRLRDDVLPRQPGTNLVGGSTAAELDSTAEINQGMPIFLLVVVGLSAVLLAVVFRSVFIPLKAAVLNLLTIGASLGVVTLVFNGSGPIDAFVPVMIFAIVFGLSMDYEVFLMSRMHEEYERGKDAERAIAVGLSTTGRVITAAGAIMIVVFGAFIVSPDLLLQQFGLGLGVAILLDAFLIRCLIVPAAMQLMGDRAWWMPTWLARRLPRVALEA